MTMRSIADRRYRIALHARETSYGAGGRPIASYPLIASVWAAQDNEDQSLSERGDKQASSASATFTTDYKAPYMQAKRIRLGRVSYRVVSVRKSGVLHPSLQFTVQRETTE